MKVRKRLWGAVLLLCALLCMVTVIVSADDSGIHTHPICGATHTDIGDHTEECADVVWTAWNGTDDIDYGESNTAYVYLTGDATRSNGLTVTGGTLNLCLNGKTLNSGITVEGNGTLNICDCRGGGAITGDSAPVIYVKTVNESNVHTTLNLYGGKISGSSDTFSSGMIELYNNDYGNAQTVAVFNMYGGEVINGGSDGAAVYANYANVGSAYYSLNIYGGSVGSEKGDGFYFDNNKNITIQIAGGTITSGGYAVNLCSGNTLTLSGSPKFIDKVSSGNSAGIYLPKDTSFIVKDDFIGTASVMQALGETVKGVIAKSESGNSLSKKVQHFTSAEEGYFVECDADGHLRLTACAITEQPTASNRYTVAANGNHYYQWYRAKRDNVSLTSENATAGDFSYSSGWGESGTISE